MIRMRGDVIQLDYALANGHTRVVRFRPEHWSLAIWVPYYDGRYQLATPQTVASAMTAINRVALEQEAPPRHWLDRVCEWFFCEGK